MKDILERLNKLKLDIKTLANKTGLSQDEAKELQGKVEEAERLQLQIKALQMADDGAPGNGNGAADDDIQGMAGLKSQVDGFSKQLNDIMQYMQDAPALKNVGYFTQDGGNADKNIKNFGDFLISIMRKDEARLLKHYGSGKALATDPGSAGGYLVPEEYRSDLIKIQSPRTIVRPLAQRIPISAPAGKFPALDQYFAPTAGQGDSAFAGRVTAAITEEGATMTETEPQFEQIEWNVNKIGGITYINEELRNDAPAIEALLRMLFGVAIAHKEEYFFFRGTGVGQPLGILNWGGLVSITVDTDNTFALVDAIEMHSRFFEIGGRSAWAVHNSLLPDIHVMTAESTGGNVPFLQDLTMKPRGALIGYPVYPCEHLPQANNSGAALIGDFSAYYIFDHEELTIDFSEHYKFGNDQGTWRFKERLDGKPGLKSSITLADPQGNFTVSPFVKMDD
jgi:HK97 family phage major capsid protein